MPLIRQQDVPPPQNPYARLKLEDNPFPSDPIIRPRSKNPRNNGQVFADGCRREVITRFENTLIRPQDFDNRSKLALLWSEGDKESGRGTGKTALLRHFQHRINKDWGQSEFHTFNAAVIYVAFPDQIDRLFSEQLAWAALLDAHESGLIKAASASLRLNIAQQRWPTHAATLLAKVEEAEAIDQDSSVDLMFDNLTLETCGINPADLEVAFIERLDREGVDEDVAVAFYSNTLRAHLASLRRDGKVRPYWVQRDTKALGLAKEIAFDQLVRFLIACGFRGGYVFIDDVENLTDLMTNRLAIEFAKEMGLLFLRPGRAAGDTGFYSAVLTTHLQAATKLASGWREAGLQAVARLDKDADTSICVPLPNQDGALEMMAAYIKHYRTPGAAVSDLHPFTEAAARKLVSGVRPALHPRTFLQKAHFAVRAALTEGTETIDEASIERLFAEQGAFTAPQASDIVEHDDY